MLYEVITIFFDVIGKPRLQPIGFKVDRPGERVPGIGDDLGIGGEEADIGRTLIQVAHHDVDA